MKRYSIGDFAKHLCVTPDFLKYYEKKGLLKPEVNNEAGYRCYHFWERGQVLECIKLRNCGFTSQEVVSLLHSASLEDYLEKIVPRQAELRTQLDHLQAQMVAFQNLQALSPCFGPENSWEIKNEEGVYFLPHAEFDTFFEGKELGDITKSWLSWMPTVQSTIRYATFPDAGTDRRSMTLGFTVSETFARKNQFHLEPPVEYIPPQRWLKIYLRDVGSRPDPAPSRERTAASPRRVIHTQIAQEIISRHHLTVKAGPYYIKKLLQLQKDDEQTNYSILQIALQ